MSGLEDFARINCFTGQHILQTNLAILRNQILANSPHWKLIHYGFRLYSKSEEDGIIQEIFNRIGIEYGTFCEIGAERGVECNTAKLLIEGWAGDWVESDPQNIDAMRKSFSAFDMLGMVCKLVTAENANDLVDPDLDLLVIDIDFNDYWVWEAVQSKPRVVVIEYNACYAPPMSIVTPYDPKAKWDNTNYAGASLGALVKLGKRKGYTLVGCDISGSNAFFVWDEFIDKFHQGPWQDFYEPQRPYFSLGQYNAPSPRPFVVIE